MKAIYAGSFDPFTNGHLHVIHEALEVFDNILLVMAKNSDKKRRTSEVDMAKAIGTALSEVGITTSQVNIVITDCLVSDVAKAVGITHSVRGIRNGMDYEYEENMAKINEDLDLKTIYFRAGNLSHVSSSMVMELFKHDADVSKYVPLPVLKLLKGEYKYE